MTDREVLIKARELIASPENWTQGTFACDANGMSVEYNSPNVCRYCILGAIQKATNGLWGGAASRLAGNLSWVYGNSIALFNDSITTTHADVLKLFDRTLMETP